MLVPVTITLAPATISLGAGKSAQFTASVTGASNTSVTWSITPAVGSIANGLYLAPTTVTTAQNVTVKATSVADPTKIAQATVSLTPAGSPSSIAVSPTQASLSASQTQQFSASVSGGLGGGGGVSVTWSISPAVGSITQTGLYTAPSSVSAQQNIIVTATGSGASNSATVTLNPAGQAPPPGNPPPPQPPPPTQPPTSTGTLPLEVMGAAGATVPVSVSIPAGSNLNGQVQLWLQVHGLKYETEASVQVNGGAWTPINTSTVTLQGNGALYGGIGGGFSTLKLTLNLPQGSITTGTNTLVFRFNGTDGITSGFRVLNLNILDPSGNQLVPAGSFTQDDPSTWQPPLNDTADIQAGQTLWRTASLVTPSGAIQAHCADCHAQDGRDLKYFNYSNFSIEARAMFHGLTQQQGQQIASYIRWLSAPAPSNARPWNPPYQPGPGQSTVPVVNWSAGAGLDAVLDQDSEMLSYLMPGGSTAAWAGNARLNANEIPIPFQLMDWNQWLPQIHPIDVYGAAFTSSALNQGYLQIRSMLIPNNAASYQNVVTNSAWPYWLNNGGILGGPSPDATDPRWSNPNFVRQWRSLPLWGLVKFWELNQEFGLEGMAPAVFNNAQLAQQTFSIPPGTPSWDRGWFTSIPFFAGPGIGKVPRPSPGIGNGTVMAHIYQSWAWYNLQLLVNDAGIDWPYAMGYPTNDLTWDSQNSVPRTGTAGFMMLWVVKALQNDHINNAQTPKAFVGLPGQISWWIQISPSQKMQLMNSYTATWLAYFGSLSPAQFKALPLAIDYNADPTQTQFGNDLLTTIPMLRFAGVNSNLLNQMVSWASTIWPSYNWAGDLNAVCTVFPGTQFLCASLP